MFEVVEGVMFVDVVIFVVVVVDWCVDGVSDSKIKK